MVFPCPAAMLSGAFVLGMLSVPAQARTNAPHPERLPSGSARPLTVVLKDGNFSIQTKASPPSTTEARKTVRLGNSLTFDRQLFEHTSLTQLEIKHAAQH